jgi:palmitoyltransferase
LTNPGTVPDNSVWNIIVPNNVPPELHTEFINLIIERKEDQLNQNRNILGESLNETSVTNAEHECFIVNERSENNGIRYCLKCRKFKPDRCHHCKFCNVCVLKMDHHCPWVGNCIGFNNYKFFLNMIFYAFANSLYFVYIFGDVIKYLIIEEKIVSFKLIFFVVMYFFMIMIMLSLSIFNIFHFSIVIKNYTTFEFVTNVVRPGENPSKKSTYDISLWENFTQVYGKNILLWLIPVSNTITSKITNGINFKQNAKFEYEIIKSV